MPLDLTLTYELEATSRMRVVAADEGADERLGRACHWTALRVAADPGFVWGRRV
jgi:hypothetical protein